MLALTLPPSLCFKKAVFDNQLQLPDFVELSTTYLEEEYPNLRSDGRECTGKYTEYMDPLSIAVSVVGLLGATAKVSSILTTFIRGTNNAPKLANGVLQEVSDISACLAQLQAFLVGTRVGLRSRTALIMVENVVVTLTACVMTFSELEATLEPLNECTPTRISIRIAWMKKEPELARLCLRLNSSKQSLNLMLTTLTWYTFPSSRLHITVD